MIDNLISLCFQVLSFFSVFLCSRLFAAVDGTSFRGLDAWLRYLGQELDKTTNGIIFSRRGIMQDDTGSAPQKRGRERDPPIHSTILRDDN
ncbi:hypothetical protein M430DRAFT_185550 [Amorphotheca resinae ATCC 22711]|uniref:Secreted protein n=1 Tax=Amorphotheca resinae ATCC 22711 TaxID=857342 RepID=A0A2T3ASH4_AMORE|nr:hypothetical protein M430DRAFT_185550 [Amorphotheca resinae ATCC 22711]PSS09329.1 hypothetical protein M430DRAFT_185550 [Amorphotheca resinae ATCC 22711]